MTPTCDNPGRSFDNQIIACILRAPTTGVFNISIIDNNHEHSGLRFAAVGTRLLDFDADLSKAYGCEEGMNVGILGGYRLDTYESERKDKWVCNHAAYITFKGQGLAGLVGIFPSPRGFVTHASPMLGGLLGLVGGQFWKSEPRCRVPKWKQGYASPLPKARL